MFHPHKQVALVSLHNTTGTFGQPEPWDIYNVSTWQHPMAPFDVLVDPMSMPEHPVIEGKINTHQVVHEDSAANSDGEEVCGCHSLSFSC